MKASKWCRQNFIRLSNFSFKRNFSDISNEKFANFQKNHIGYPVNYYLEYEKKQYDEDNLIIKSIKTSCLEKNINSLALKFNEQNFILALYKNSHFLSSNLEKQKINYEKLQSILKENIQNIEKFSTCCTILQKTLHDNFQIDKFLIERLFEKGVKTAKEQYCYRDNGKMVVYFYELFFKIQQQISPNIKIEFEEYCLKNIEKIGFAGIRRIISIFNENSSKCSKALLIKAISEINYYLLVLDFLGYFNLLKTFLNVLDLEIFEKNIEEKAEFLKEIDLLIKNANKAFSKKIDLIYRNTNKIEENPESNKKEFIEDVSLLLKICMKLKNLSFYLQQLEGIENPVKDFKNIFRNEKFSMSEKNKKQIHSLLLYYKKFVEKEDEDGEIKDFIKILFSGK